MSSSAKFNIGDIVKLKSGGPDMTVKTRKINLKGEFNRNYACQWFAGKKLEIGEFHEDSIEIVTP